MGRIKRVTLFKKNHIEITREEYPTRIFTPGVDRSFMGSSDRLYYWSPGYSRKKKVVLKSPLGFYYEKEILVVPDKNKGKHNPTHSGTVYTIKLPDTKYQISYFTSYGNSKIQKGLDGPRPWELDPSDGGMSDHFVEDLKKEVDKILDIVNQHKLSEKPGELKKDIYTDLFGFPEGPKYQTDLEKIESHGFDSKVSFRKRK